MQPLVVREKQAKVTYRSIEEIITGYLKRVAVEVDKDTALPEGMYRKVVQRAKYAVFTVNGNNANGEIGKAFQYIYHVWLPNSEYCIDENALFDFEYYDERWDCQFGAAQMDIYVPVRRMEH